MITEQLKSIEDRVAERVAAGRPEYENIDDQLSLMDGRAVMKDLVGALDAFEESYDSGARFLDFEWEEIVCPLLLNEPRFQTIREKMREDIGEMRQRIERRESEG